MRESHGARSDARAPMGAAQCEACHGPGEDHMRAILTGRVSYPPVRFGMASRQLVEVLEGLEEGDEVIISETQEMDHLDRFRVE